jgi:hypothetical protein
MRATRVAGTIIRSAWSALWKVSIPKATAEKAELRTVSMRRLSMSFPSLTPCRVKP